MDNVLTEIGNTFSNLIFFFFSPFNFSKSNSKSFNFMQVLNLSPEMALIMSAYVKAGPTFLIFYLFFSSLIDPPFFYDFFFLVLIHMWCCIWKFLMRIKKLSHAAIPNHSLGKSLIHMCCCTWKFLMRVLRCENEFSTTKTNLWDPDHWCGPYYSNRVQLLCINTPLGSDSINVAITADELTQEWVWVKRMGTNARIPLGFRPTANQI